MSTVGTYERKEAERTAPWPGVTFALVSEVQRRWLPGSCYPLFRRMLPPPSLDQVWAVYTTTYHAEGCPAVGRKKTWNCTCPTIEERRTLWRLW